MLHLKTLVVHSTTLVFHMTLSKTGISLSKMGVPLDNTGVLISKQLLHLATLVFILGRLQLLHLAALVFILGRLVFLVTTLVFHPGNSGVPLRKTGVPCDCSSVPCSPTGVPLDKVDLSLDGSDVSLTPIQLHWLTGCKIPVYLLVFPLTTLTLLPFDDTGAPLDNTRLTTPPLHLAASVLHTTT